MIIPAPLRKYADKISSMEDDRANQNGYWCYLKVGWKSPSDPLGVEHQIHEDTLGTIAAMLKDVEACNCPECRADAVMDQVSSTDEP